MTDDMSREDTYLGFDRSTMKGWLKMLYSEGGWIGQWIIRTIYGSNQDFDTDILDAINSKYPVQQKDQKRRHFSLVEEKTINFKYKYRMKKSYS